MCDRFWLQAIESTIFFSKLRPLAAGQDKLWSQTGRKLGGIAVRNANQCGKTNASASGRSTWAIRLGENLTTKAGQTAEKHYAESQVYGNE